MANRTVKDAISVRGTNPQYLIEKIIRSRIYDSKYWKEECFALSAELIVDRAMELRYLGGVYGGNIKPTPFICLILKLLQIQPSKDIVIEFIRQEDFKYVRALGALYLRLTGSALDCYKYLEPLYNDYKKLRVQNKMGKFELLHMDEFIDDLFRQERVFDIILPRIQARHVLEESNQLEPLKSALEDDLDLEESEEEDVAAPAQPPSSSDKHTSRRAEEEKSNKHKHHRHRERGSSRSPPPQSKRRGRSRERAERERAEREHHHSARNDYYPRDPREVNDYYPNRETEYYVRDEFYSRESEYYAPRDRSDRDRDRHKKRSDHGEKKKKRKRSHSRTPPPPSRYY